MRQRSLPNGGHIFDTFHRRSGSLNIARRHIIPSLWEDCRLWKRTCFFTARFLIICISSNVLPLLHLTRIYLTLVVIFDLCLDVSDTTTLVAVRRYNKPLLKNGGVYHYVRL